MASTLSEFSLRVIGAIKAELARRNLSGADLIPVLEISRNAVYARLRGEKSFELEEVVKVAAFLGIPVETLVAAPVIAQVAA